jgi:hypothetical protein
MKRIAIVFLGALLLLIGVLTFTSFGSSTMDTYAKEKNAGQTLTVLADKRGVHSLIVGIFTEPQGYYFLQTSGPPAKGRFTRNDGELHLNGSDGRQWTLTIQPDDSLRDESGAIWRLQAHSESSMTVAKNRADCQDKLGKECPY